MEQDQPQKLDTLQHLVQHFNNGMLVTLSRDSTLHARPMAIAGFDAPATLWFIMSGDSVKAEEVGRDGRAAVTMQAGQRFVALSGHGTVSRELDKLRELWSPLADIWFEGGPSDPRAALLRFDAEQAEYWDGSGMRGLKFVLEAAKAVATGDTLNDERDPRAHGQLRL